MVKLNQRTHLQRQMGNDLFYPAVYRKCNLYTVHVNRLFFTMFELEQHEGRVSDIRFVTQRDKVGTVLHGQYC